MADKTWYEKARAVPAWANYASLLDWADVEEAEGRQYVKRATRDTFCLFGAFIIGCLTFLGEFRGLLIIGYVFAVVSVSLTPDKSP